MSRTPRDASPRKRRSRPTPRWLTKQTDLDTVARNRVMLVLSVLSGEKPVTTAIEEAAISRGFYYQLETKAINAMLLALAPGADGDSSPDATGLHERIKQLEDKLAKAEASARRADRLLFIQRKLNPGPVKTKRGRPKKTTSSTPPGRRDWRSSMTTKAVRRTRSSSTRVTTAATPATASIPTSAGASADPTAGSENSRAPTPRATT